MLYTDGIAYTFGSQRGGVMTLTYRDAERVDTRHDSLAFGLTTTQRDAVVLHVVSANSNDYISIELVSRRRSSVLNNSAWPSLRKEAQ